MSQSGTKLPSRVQVSGLVNGRYRVRKRQNGVIRSLAVTDAQRSLVTTER